MPTPDDRSASTLLRATVRAERRRLAASSMLFVGHQLGEALVPVVAGALVDRAIVTADGGALLRWLAILAAVFAVLSTSWRLGDRLLSVALEEAAHELRLRLTERFLAPAGVAGTPSGGQVVSVATTDVIGTVRILAAVAAGLAAAAALVTTAIVLLVISAPLGLVVLLGLPAVVVVEQALVRPLEERTGAQRTDAAAAASLATDLLTGVRVLAGLRAGGAASARYRAASRRSLDAGLRAARLAAVHEGTTVIATGGFIAVVAGVAGVLAADGRISIGALIAAVGVTQFLVGPLWRVGWATGELARARASAARVAPLLVAPGAIADGTDVVPEGPGELVLHGVSHRGVRGLDLAVGAGELVALAVLDPRDAATIVDLLARVEDPGSGSITLDGRPLPQLRLELLRRELVVARHDAVLFSGTVSEIVGGADVHALVAAVAAEDLHEQLPEGVETHVATGGTSLSGGQRQRLALARALGLAPRVLVLHDPTTAVDPMTEARLAAGLRERRRGATTLVLTTSPALLAVADRVVVVDDGRVRDVGSHDELLGRDDRYAAAVLT
jgi:putative ABC transport system ATP-binding protein